MKRKRDRPLTPSERRSLMLLTVFLLLVIGLGVWLHLGHIEFSPPPELSMRAGEDLRIPVPQEKDCTPIPVQFRTEGDSLVVRASDIEAGRPLFAREQN